MAIGICDTCGKQFNVRPAVLKCGKGRYCSRDCSSISRRDGEFRTCRQCNATFYARRCHLDRGWGTYCSRACRDQSQLTGHFPSCHTCGTKIYRPPCQTRKSRSGLFFCNHSCRVIWTNRQHAGEKHPKWKTGYSVYRSILLRSGSPMECRRCGLTDERVLAVHHLDGDRTNNNLANLSWLCHNCHHATHHYDDKREVVAVVPDQPQSSPATDAHPILDVRIWTGEYKSCATCGAPVYRSRSDISKSRRGRFFCNQRCRALCTNKERAREKHPNWKGGEASYRDALLRSGARLQCRRCGLTDERVLAVHHIDGDRTHNSLENLSWLCHNCHYLIHHYED
jgi:hypothetical protein